MQAAAGTMLPSGFPARPSDFGSACPVGGGTGNDLLPGGDSDDLFLFDFFRDYQLPDDGNPGYQKDEANDLVTDFAKGEDKISMTLRLFNADADLDVDTNVTFGDLDTNRDGVLTSADDAIGPAMSSHGGETKPSLTIDAGQLTPPSFGASSLQGTITLSGVTALTAGDFSGDLDRCKAAGE